MEASAPSSEERFTLAPLRQLKNGIHMGWISVLSRHHILSPAQLSKKSKAMDGTEYLTEGPMLQAEAKAL